MTKKTILMCMMGFALLCVPMSANAQGVAKVITKAGRAISKAASKGGGKAVSKTGATAGATAAANGASATSKAGKTKFPEIKKKGKNEKSMSNPPKTQKRGKTYECPKCDGKGTIKKWDDYLGPYDSTCPRCLGLGYKYVRY